VDQQYGNIRHRCQKLPWPQHLRDGHRVFDAPAHRSERPCCCQDGVGSTFSSPPS